MATKVLIVLDGGYRFANAGGIPDFTYTALVDALVGAGMVVTKAHRGMDATADLQNFNFAAANLSNFDVIWLIGLEGRNSTSVPPSGTSLVGGLGPAQLNALAQFMDEGGGVFATGDHDSIGADMSGYVPRVRAMRCWYGANDPAKPSGLASVPPNYPPMTPARADTTRPNPAGVYTAHPQPFVWFENQSDSVPQPLTPASSPAHPILRRNGADIVVFPDHMHEGTTLGALAGHDYTANSPYGDTSKAEFREVAGHRELPQVIATGQTAANANFGARFSPTDSTIAAARSINLLSVYDGRKAGVGRIVTGSTFHHYVDINLTGDSDITAGSTEATNVGADAVKGQGFNANPAVFDDIKAVFVNITAWLARPAPRIGLILERSTFSQDEATATPDFPGAVLVTVDGLTPSRFPGGPPVLGAVAGPAAWAPIITVAAGVPIVVEPEFVSSDDPTLPDRPQRFTFRYRVRFTGPAFGFAGQSSAVPVEAQLSLGADILTDRASFQLVKSANPFMLDLADGNEASWLSSDVKVFRVVEGSSFLGVALPANASRDDALRFLRTVVSTINTAQFTALPSAAEASLLSSLPFTVAIPPRRVYNFALARVRLSSAGADADPVRVFFRMFTTQTTASLTHYLDGAGLPIEGYLRSAGADPIALPGTQNGGGEWVSFPFFSAPRQTPQTDPDNVQAIAAATGFRIFGALIDNNLGDPYLTQTPTGGPVQPLPALLMGEHQCLVAQVEFAGAPIPHGATPWTSDKLAQRNLAVSPVANPGLDASRVAMHTFEIEATPHAISATLPPDELMLEWSERTPQGTVLRIHIPTWNAYQVVELADQIYARHEIEAVDAHTIEMPGGGVRYVPIPMSLHRQNGVISVEYPLGIIKGQRFDVSVRQLTNRFRHANIPPHRTQVISQKEAAEIIGRLPQAQPEAEVRARGRGAFNLGENKVLFTDLSYFDAPSDNAMIIEYPAPEVVAKALADAARWREPIGAFQLGAPVSTRDQMLRHQMALLSVMRWRTGQLPRTSRWRKTMLHYVDLLAAKVQALGGDAFAVPATPDGVLPWKDAATDPPGGADPGKDGADGRKAIELIRKLLRTQLGCGLALAVLLVLVVLLWMALT